MDHPKPASPLVNHDNCEHLRHKGMYVMSVVDPAEFQFYDKYDATAYWCTKTQKPLGPDGKAAHASACHDGPGGVCERSSLRVAAVVSQSNRSQAFIVSSRHRVFVVVSAFSRLKE